LPARSTRTRKKRRVAEISNRARQEERSPRAPSYAQTVIKKYQRVGIG
jgi:hypothetical protein